MSALLREKILSGAVRQPDGRPVSNATCAEQVERGGQAARVPETAEWGAV